MSRSSGRGARRPAGRGGGGRGDVSRLDGKRAKHSYATLDQKGSRAGYGGGALGKMERGEIFRGGSECKWHQQM